MKQNGRLAAILDWIAKQNDKHMYVVLLCLCVKFEKNQSRHVCVKAQDMKIFKQNGRQSAILDWIAKQNDVHMYVKVLCHCAKFERIPFRHVRDTTPDARTHTRTDRRMLARTHGNQTISPSNVDISQQSAMNILLVITVKLQGSYSCLEAGIFHFI